MKQLFHHRILPLFTILAGGLGLALRLWLFSTGVDEKGLLISAHPANSLIFILTALVLLVLFLTTKDIKHTPPLKVLFPRSFAAAFGCFAAAAGILAADITEYLTIRDTVSLVCCVLGLIAAAALVFAGVCRLQGKHPAYLFHAAVTIYFVLHLVLQFRVWSPEPELQRYAFPLFASVFLMLTAYHRATLDAQTGKRRAFVFCSQAALFFCMISLNGQDWLFYLTMAAWTATGLCAPDRPVPTQEEA